MTDTSAPTLSTPEVSAQIPSLDPFDPPSFSPTGETVKETKEEVPAPETSGDEIKAEDDLPPLPENWHEREEVQTRLKDSHSEGWRKGYSKADQVAKERLSSVQQRAQVYDGLQDLIKAVEKVAEEGGLLVEDDRARRNLADLLARSPALAQAVQLSEEELANRGQTASLQAFVNLASGNLSDHQDEMSAYVTRLMEDTQVGISDSKDFWPSLFAMRDKLVSKAAFEKGRQAGIESERKAKTKSTAAATRQDLKGPVPKAGGRSASSGGPMTLEDIKSMSVAEIAALSPDQKAQMDKILSGA